jgi:tRNA uridine 5-carbamoylmethylation protein Kti12
LHELSDYIPEKLDSTKEALVFCRKKDLNQENHELLIKILGAVNHNLENTNIVALEDSSILDISALMQIIKPKSLLSFEINLNTNGLNLDQKLYKVMHLLDTSIIISESLSTLQQNKESKLKLWNALKEHFIKKS